MIDKKWQGLNTPNNSFEMYNGIVACYKVNDYSIRKISIELLFLKSKWENQTIVKIVKQKNVYSP